MVMYYIQSLKVFQAKTFIYYLMKEKEKKRKIYLITRKAVRKDFFL